MYRLLVTDPETNEEFELWFEVTTASRERLDVVRILLQKQLGDIPAVRPVSCITAQILGELEAQDIKYTERQLPLWNTWLILMLVLNAHTEWLARKLSNSDKSWQTFHLYIAALNEFAEVSPGLVWRCTVGHRRWVVVPNHVWGGLGW